tara:strand:+ start:1705 stop:1911 length:207 start_codon:yes stop_codon:yes gene_type:complete
MLERTKSIVEMIRRRRNLNNTIKQMHEMTERELSDIGISRSQIEAVARGVIDVHRTVRDINEKEATRK